MSLSRPLGPAEAVQVELGLPLCSARCSYCIRQARRLSVSGTSKRVFAAARARVDRCVSLRGVFHRVLTVLAIMFYIKPDFTRLRQMNCAQVIDVFQLLGCLRRFFPKAGVCLVCLASVSYPVPSPMLFA